MPPVTQVYPPPKVHPLCGGRTVDQGRSVMERAGGRPAAFLSNVRLRA